MDRTASHRIRALVSRPVSSRAFKQKCTPYICSSVPTAFSLWHVLFSPRGYREQCLPRITSHYKVYKTTVWPQHTERFTPCCAPDHSLRCHQAANCRLLPKTSETAQPPKAVHGLLPYLVRRWPRQEHVGVERMCVPWTFVEVKSNFPGTSTKAKGTQQERSPFNSHTFTGPMWRFGEREIWR